MKLRVFTLPFEPARGFDTTEADAFFEDHEALSVTDHVLEHAGVPWLVLVVTYQALDRDGGSSRGAGRRKGPDPRAELDPAQQKVYDALRSWRAHRGRDEGVPVYMVATNRQLAQVVQQRPTTLAALDAIDGFGDGRRKRHGEALLAALGKLAAPAKGSSEPVDALDSGIVEGSPPGEGEG